MMDLVEIERQAARKELGKFRFFREWKKSHRKYSTASIRNGDSFDWSEFREDKEPIIGFEQICSDQTILRDKMKFNVFLISLMYATRDMPEDMVINVGIGVLQYAKFMRMHYLFSELYVESLHYMFDQLKDDYLVIIKDERRADIRSYAKVYSDGRIKRVLLNRETSIVYEQVPEEILIRIKEASNRLVSEERLQQIESTGNSDDNCVMVKFGLNVWGKGDIQNTYFNERIDGESKYPFIRELMDLECMRGFRE